MIVDFNSVEASTMDVDVCIVGAGAAGYALATQFLAGPFKVALVEGGDVVPRPECKDLHRAEVIGSPHSGVHTARERVVGGTTTTWGGQALPFCSDDFEPREWVANSGWPFGHNVLKPYYDRAEATLGLNPLVDFEVRPWAKAGITEPVFSEESLELFVSKWSPHPNFAIRYGSDLQKSAYVRLLYNANAVWLSLTEGGHALHGLEIRSLSGRAGRINAKYFILAGGAIETARLLLVSNDVQARGIGNSRDLVGRYFQDHTASILGLIVPPDRGRIHDLFDPFYLQKLKYQPRIRMSPRKAARCRILHASLQIVIQEQTNGALGAAKQLRGRIASHQIDSEAFRLAGRAIRSPSTIAGMLLRRAVRGRGALSRTGPIWLECHCEQEPDRDSRVTLSDQRDALGVRRVRLDWRITDLTHKTLRIVAELAKVEFDKAGVGSVILEDWVTSFDSNWRRYIGDAAHQCGTTRMGLNPSVGVVDSDCRVFGVENLFVASSAVFPTSSFSNPTMTIIALALRVADRVKNLLDGGNSNKQLAFAERSRP